MSFENKPPIQESEPEISWSATAERFNKKIEEERTKYINTFGDDGGILLQKLNELESTISELFSVYEKKGMSIKSVEDDIKYRRDSETDESQKTIHRQILNLIDGRGLKM